MNLDVGVDCVNPIPSRLVATTQELRGDNVRDKSRTDRVYAVNPYGIITLMRLLVFFIIPLLTSCSFNSSPTTPPTPLSSLELYMARTNLFDTDFEQYKLQGQRLFIECGKLKRGRQMSETHDLFALTPEQRQNIEQRAGAILGSVNQSAFEFSAPGTNKHLADSGQISLKLGSTEINTSVDAIATPSQRPERLTKELVELLRSHSTKGCAKAEFYGIGRRSS